MLRNGSNTEWFIDLADEDQPTPLDYRPRLTYWQHLTLKWFWGLSKSRDRSEMGGLPSGIRPVDMLAYWTMRELGDVVSSTEFFELVTEMDNVFLDVVRTMIKEREDRAKREADAKKKT